MEYSISVWTLFFLLLSVSTPDFNRDSSTETVFSTAVEGVYAAQTVFAPCTVADALTPQQNEVGKIGDPCAGITPSRPESADHRRQATARSTRRIARHAALAAAATSANMKLASAAHAPADLTSSVRAPTDLTSAVHAPTDLVSAVHAPADLTSAVQAPTKLTSDVQVSAGLTSAVSTTICRPTGLLPPVRDRNAPAPNFSPHQTRPATPLAPHRAFALS